MLHSVKFILVNRFMNRKKIHLLLFLEIYMARYIYIYKFINHHQLHQGTFSKWFVNILYELTRITRYILVASPKIVEERELVKPEPI